MAPRGLMKYFHEAKPTASAKAIKDFTKIAERDQMLARTIFDMLHLSNTRIHHLKANS